MIVGRIVVVSLVGLGVVWLPFIDSKYNVSQSSDKPRPDYQLLFKLCQVEVAVVSSNIFKLFRLYWALLLWLFSPLAYSGLVRMVGEDWEVIN